MARSRAQQKHTLLERELQWRKEQARACAAPTGVRVKEEPLSEEAEAEPMDTSPSGGLHSRLANGLPAGRAAGGDSFNGHPPPGGTSTPVAQELRAFVEATFQRQFVLTLSELKRLFNLHLASLPPGHMLFSGISDRMLQDTVLAAGCKQILVPVSREDCAPGWPEPCGVGSLQPCAGWDRGVAGCWVESPAGASAHPCLLRRVLGLFLVFCTPQMERLSFRGSEVTLLKAMCPDSEGTGICTLCRSSVSISGTGPPGGRAQSGRGEWGSGACVADPAFPIAEAGVPAGFSPGCAQTRQQMG